MAVVLFADSGAVGLRGGRGGGVVGQNAGRVSLVLELLTP